MKHYSTSNKHSDSWISSVYVWDIMNLTQVCLCSWYSKMDIPASDSFSHPTRKGFLHKLTSRGWLYSAAWKKRFCILHASKLYFYENELSKGTEKSCGVLNLDYYDVCEEFTPKDKKQQHAFVIGTSVKGFFDNRHPFAADSEEELQGWMTSIRSAIEEARLKRHKSGRKLQHSPRLSASSQEEIAEGTTDCLVNANKDRVRGPLGRRPPQRKSMMPASRKAEVDSRQRSVSLSGPERTGDSSPGSQSPTDSDRWLSVSMEEVKRSSSAFDIPQQEAPPTHKKVGPRTGNLLGQHAALTQELEMRLKAGMTPGARRTQPQEAIPQGSTGEKDDSRKEGHPSQVEDVLLQVTAALQEVERIKAEYKQALVEVKQAKSEYHNLTRECKETLARLNAGPESQQDAASHAK